MTPSPVLAAAVLLTASMAPVVGRGQTPSASPAAATQPSPMPAALLAKLIKLVPASGADGALPPAVADSLGLGSAGQGWPDRQLAVQSNSTGAIHAVAVSRAGDPDVIMSVRGPAAVTVFRLRPDGSLVGAVSYFPQTKLTMKVLSGQALDGLAGERQFWVTHLDSLPTPE